MSEINCTDFDDYQQRALLTLNVQGKVENMTHAIMGMCGEAGEFAETPYEQRDKRIGELGDCMWYSAVLAHELGLPFSTVVDGACANMNIGCEFKNNLAEHRAMLWACRLIDVIKKTVFYGKPVNETVLRKYLSCYVQALLDMATKTNILLLDAGTINIRKLAARYPDLKFDADRAINRDYSVESKAAGVEIS